jgi:hypothetical protein
MDWPVATVILGVLGTVSAAIIKILPQKTKTIHENAKGEPCATKTDMANLNNEIKQLHEYTSIRNHDILNALQGVEGRLRDEIDPIKRDVITLVERTSRRTT